MAEDIHSDLHHVVPGQAVQNIVKRRRRIWRGARTRGRASVEGIDDFCAARELEIKPGGREVPGDPRALTFLRLGSRPDHTLPVCTGERILLIFTVWAFVKHIITVCQSFLAHGLVGQADFVFKVCWHGYTVGILGVPVFWKQGKNWCKHFLPLLFVLGLKEDTDHYALLYEMALLVLETECLRRSIRPPQRWFSQMHSDFHDGARRAGMLVLPGTRLVNDLEHMFRALKDHQSRPSRLQTHDIAVVIAYCAFTAYLPNAAAFHLFWE